MTARSFLPRFLESSRGRVLQLLRRGPMTVDEIAADLELTDNAVRSHLTALERDGMIRSGGVRRVAGAGKPAHLFEIAPAAEPLFSSAYVPLTVALLDVLSARMTTTERNSIMRDVGQRLAQSVQGTDRGTLRDRAEAAVTMLASLGGIAEVETDHGKVEVVGKGCPLSAVVCDHPEACDAVAKLVGTATGTRAQVRCDHGARPSCRFELTSRSRS